MFSLSHRKWSLRPQIVQRIYMKFVLDLKNISGLFRFFFWIWELGWSSFQRNFAYFAKKNCFTFIALICFAKKCENFVKKQIQNILVGKKCENFTKKIRIISCGIYNTCRNVYFGRGRGGWLLRTKNVKIINEELTLWTVVYFF